MKSSPPDQPKVLSFRAQIGSDRVELTIRSGSRAAGCFMLFWLTGWTGGCALIIWRYLTDPQPETLLFGIPFWASWLFVVCFATSSLLGREVFRLDERGATYYRRILFWRWARVELPLDELIRFGTIVDENHDADSIGTGLAIELKTIGRPIRFGSTLIRPECDWLRHTLNQKLQAWQRTTNRKPTLPIEASVIRFNRPLTGELLGDGAQADSAVRTPNDLAIDPPSDSRWRVRDDFDSVRYSLRGRVSFGAMGGFLFLNLFVNGIISIFAKQVYWPEPSERLYGIEWLYRFLFLIPFEIVGLILFLGLLLIVLEPVRIWSWRFARERIVWKLTWLGLGFRKTYRFERVDRLEVRRIDLKKIDKPKMLSLGRLWAPHGCRTYNLTCLAPHGDVVAEIEGLTLGEACWMADSLLRRHPDWIG